MEESSPRLDMKVKLDQDNQATIRTILHEVTSWRTRHYALRAAWTRDIISAEGIEVEHVPGVEICGPINQSPREGQVSGISQAASIN